MAENPYLDLAVTVAVNRYDLDETEWSLTSFSEGGKTITVGLTDGETKLKVTFDREDIRFEEIKRWTDERKLAYAKHLVENGMELHEKLVDSFHHVMLKLDLPSANLDDDDTIIVELEAGESFNVVLGESFVPEDTTDESAEEFEAKVEGKKAPKKPLGFKRKVV